MANRLKGSARPLLCQLPNAASQAWSRCSRKATCMALARYDSEGGSTTIEKPCCDRHATHVLNRLPGGPVKIGVFRVWSIQPLSHVASARPPKMR